MTIRTIIGMDALTDILELIQLKSAVYFRSDFASPWGMEVPAGAFAQFHMVVRGRCQLKLRGASIADLESGDIVLFPHGQAHWLADSAKSKRRNGMEVVQAVVSGEAIFKGEGRLTNLICGHFEFDRSLKHPFVGALPGVIVIKGMEQQEMFALQQITNLLITEADSGKAGSQLIARRLAEVLFIKVIRCYLNQEGTHAPVFLRALQNDKISTALTLIHRSPEWHWTVEALARKAGMSRTSFANQFRQLVGDTPLNYLTNWRIQKAKQLLKNTGESISEISEKVGYQSEAAFSRVFKKRVASTPLQFRKQGM